MLQLSQHGSSRRGSRGSSMGFATIVAALLICIPVVFGHARAGAVLRRVGLDGLRVTNGAVVALRDGELAIDSPSSRAVAANAPVSGADQAAEIRFRYLGPSKDDKPLASGELRRQIGLKLRAADSCNVIYVMWHIAPDTRIAVSVKRNAAHSHAQCGAHGYETMAPQKQSAPQPIRTGEAHSLRAELHGKTLVVIADGKAVWRGIGAGEPVVGPPGFRTDNARFVLEYYASVFAGRHDRAGRPTMSGK